MATTKRTTQAKGQSPTYKHEDAVLKFSKVACLRVKLEKVKEQYAALCKQWSFLPTSGLGQSFAQVAAKQCRPQIFVPMTKKVSTPARVERVKVIPYQHDLTRREARQDYSSAWSKVQEQRRSNNELAAAIEARYAKMRAFLAVPNRISRMRAVTDARNFSRARQAEKKSNDFLAACIAFRYGMQFDAEAHSANVVPLCGTGGGVEKSIRGPCTAKRQVRRKPVVFQDWEALFVEIATLTDQDFPGLHNAFIESKDSGRRINLREKLLSTIAGKALLGGLLVGLYKSKGLDIMSCIDLAQSIPSNTPKEEEVIEAPKAQMDIEPSEISIKSDTAIDTGPVETDGLVPVTGFYAESSTNLQQVYSTLADRWLLVKNFDWKETDSFNKRIAVIELPYSVLKDNADASNANLFLQHRFYRSDIRVKILLNTNRYQIGALVASVFYYEQGSSDNGQRNVISGMQRLHHVIKAGSSSTSEFIIPYRHINSSLSLKDQKRANFCNLEFYVLNPLAVTENSASSCSISVSICFEDSKFNGLIARVVPEMNTIEDIGNLVLNPSISGAINVASSILNTRGSDQNRDNPPIPLQPMSFIPQAVGSFCNTDNIAEPINVLRSDPTGQVPHPYTTDEMTVSQLRNTWGFLKTITWETQRVFGDNLVNIPVAPLLPLSDYTNNVPSPLAMLTSMYGFWRGDIEFKFEIIANAFYEGKFMVSCVPLATTSSPPTLSQAKLSANQVYSITDSDEKIFVCPWNWYNSFAKTRREENEFDSIGLLQMFVYNPLIAITGVIPKIYVNVYVRGGANFEEAIVRPPLLYSSPTDPLIPPITQSPTPYNLESTWYATYNSSCKSATGQYPLVPYIQNVTNGWVGYTNLKEGYLYKLESRTTKGLLFRITAPIIRDNKPQNVVLKYGTYDPALSTANAHGMIMSDLESDIRNYIKELKLTKDPAKARDKLTTFWTADGPWSQVYKNKWVIATDPNDPPIWTWDGEVHEEEQSNEIPRGQMQRAIRLGKPTKPTLSGQTIFGESRPELKSYCRRYNTYGSMVVKSCTEGLPQDCPYAAALRVCPIRHVSPTSSRSFSNRYREGPISAIGELYRFWRGGLRFRFVVSGNPPEGTMMFVSHRYDLISPSDLPIYSNKDGVVLTKDDLLHTQYATYSQALSVNQVFTVEVPYYQEKEYLSLLNNTDRTITDNGSLLVWVMSTKPADLHIEVYYSFADDTRYSLFQGVGVSKDITTIAPEPEMDAGSSSNSVPNLIDLPCEEPIITPQGFVQNVKQYVGNAASYFTGKIEDVKAKTAQLKDTLTMFTETSNKIQSIKGKITSFWDYFMDLSNDIIDFLVSVFYALTAKSIMHASVAIINLLRKCFIGAKKYVISKLFSSLSGVASWVLSKQPPQVVRPEMDSSSEAVGAFGSFIFSALSSVCNVVVTPPTSFEGMRRGLFDFSNTARSAMFVKSYIGDTVEFIKRCIKVFVTKFSISSTDYKLISGLEDHRLRNWIIDSTFITAPHNQEQVIAKPEWALKAFELSLVGRALAVATAFDKVSNPRLSAITAKLSKDLEELTQILRNKKVFSGVRYEPCMVWIASTSAGIGKSRYIVHLMEEYAKKLGLDAINCYYAMTPGLKHGDGMEGKPFILADDAAALAIALDPFFYTFMLQGKSSGQYSPQFADLPLKGTLLNFQNIFASTNRKNFKNMPGILSEDAFNRRLDVPVEFRPRDGWDIQRIKTAPKEQLEALEQVDAVYYDPISGKDICEIHRVEGESYRDTVDKFIMNKMGEYHVRECARYEAACNKIRERLQSASATAGKNFDEQLEAFRKVVDSLSCSESDKIPYKDKYILPDLESWREASIRSATFDLKTSVPVYSVSPAEPDIPIAEMNPMHCWHLSTNPRNVAFTNFKSIDMLTMKELETCTLTACPFITRSIMTERIAYELCFNEFNKVETAKMLKGEESDVPPTMRNYLKEHIQQNPAISVGYLTDMVLKEQSKITANHTLVDGVPVPLNRPGWKTTVWYAIVNLLQISVMTVLAGLAVITIVSVIQTVASLFITPEPKAQLHPSGDYQTIKASQSIRAKALRLVKPEMAQRESLQEVQNQFEEKLKIIQGNTIFLIGVDPISGVTYKGRCLGLYDRTVLAIKHYFDHFLHKGIKRLKVVRPNSNTTIYDVDIDNLKVQWGDCGYGLLYLPQSYPTQFRKITQFFPSEEQTSEYPASVQMFEDSGAGYKLFSMEMTVIDEVVVPKSGTFEAWTISNGFKYPWGGSGRCGSLLLSPKLASPIIGIHTAGTDGRIGYAERLLRETFEEPDSSVEYVEPQLDTEGTIYQLDGSYTEVGRLDKSLSPNFPTETAIVPSVIAPVFPVKTEPAPLIGTDPRLETYCDILKIGASKRCDPIREFPEEMVREAVIDYKDKIISLVKPLRGNIGLLSYSQAIEGLPSDNTGPIVMSTSEGFPWRSLRPKNEKNKKWMFQFDTKVQGMKVTGIERSLYENLEYKHNLRKEGKVPASYFTCCLKDARILKEKVPIPGKTRIFEMSPIELTIAQRQYFYDYVGAYQASRVEHMIGINPDGPEWSNLANSLAEFSPFILTADYSAYGPRVNSTLLYEAYKITTAWYRHNMEIQGRIDEDLYKVQQVVAHEVAHGLHVVKDLVFRPSSGLPSGNIETVTKNSQVNSLYVRIAFLGLAEQSAPHYRDLYWFNKFVLLYTYGDDLIMSVKKEIISWFNNQTLIEFFAQYRLKMTDALKSGSTRLYCTLEEATFLKRGFKQHPTRPGQWLAPLEVASITDTANWVHKSMNPIDASLVNSEMCCRLAYTLGPDEFGSICATVKQKWLQRGHRFEFPSWQSLDSHVWEGTPGPLFRF
uniref:Genome polyprotein n=1 Tax=Ista virus TaxID=2651930 RepID=A0A5Q0TW75_9PICO|nr:RNA-dependent RNA polymerase [Ista virus]